MRRRINIYGKHKFIGTLWVKVLVEYILLLPKSKVVRRRDASTLLIVRVECAGAQGPGSNINGDCLGDKRSRDCGIKNAVVDIRRLDLKSTKQTILDKVRTFAGDYK